MRLLKNGMKIGNATVIVDIVDGTNKEIRPRTKMNPRFLTDHDTGNSGNGADAKSHNRYIHNLGDKLPRDTSHISWHVTVDENFIIQHIPFDECAYHCGDGWLLSSGNRTSVGVEKCMHRGADRNKIEANAIALYAYLMKELKLPITSVRPHQQWSGKYCPQLILNKYGSFLPFRNKIQTAYKGGAISSSPSIERAYLLDGDTGDKVRALQSGLKQAGLSLTVDGIFGKGTEITVKAFQRANGLAVDGIWGTGSQAKLNAILANLNKKPVVKTKEEIKVEYKKDTQPSASLAKEFHAAVKNGITDGTYPQRPATREEVAVMVNRAFVKLSK